MMDNAEKGYRQLRVWKEAHEFVVSIYKVTKTFPKEELYGLTSQVRRAAVSIPANIVEGHARSSKKEFRQFLYVANGSLVEVEYYLQLSKDLDYITSGMYEQLNEKRRIIGFMLHSLIKSIQ